MGREFALLEGKADLGFGCAACGDELTPPGSNTGTRTGCALARVRLLVLQHASIQATGICIMTLDSAGNVSHLASSTLYHMQAILTDYM